MNPRQWTSVPGSTLLYADLDEDDDAQRTGGMVALYPRSDYAEMLAVPGGEAEEELHCTLVYLGDDVTGKGDGGLGSALAQLAGSFPEIHARVFGHAVFNPDGFEERNPCGVYLLGDSPGLDEAHNLSLQATETTFDTPEQHVPWLPHITAAYGNPPQVGQYTGDIVFDRFGLALAGHTQFYPLLGGHTTSSWHRKSPYWLL